MANLDWAADRWRVESAGRKKPSSYAQKNKHYWLSSVNTAMARQKKVAIPLAVGKNEPDQRRRTAQGLKRKRTSRVRPIHGWPLVGLLRGRMDRSSPVDACKRNLVPQSPLKGSCAHPAPARSCPPALSRVPSPSCYR